MALRFISAALFITPVAAASCPTIKSVTLPGEKGAGKKQLLAGLNFPVTVQYTWSDPAAAAGCGSAAPAALTTFSLVAEGATATKVSLSGASANFMAEFPEGGVDTTLKVKLVDSSGTCQETSHSVERYVYTKGTPLAPFLLVFILCIATRDVYFSLGFSGVIGWMILERNFGYGILRYFDTGLPTVIAGGFKDIMLFLFLMGGVVGGTIRSGGVQGLGELVVKFIKDSFLGEAMVYLLGWAIFLDDYANTIIVGTTLRTVTDKMRISREKLSMIVDCTASPIAGVMPLSTWIAHELLQMKLAFEVAGYTAEQPYTIFLRSIPNRFYSWYMLIFVANNAIMGRDWGFMYFAEKRARETGEVANGVFVKPEGEAQNDAEEAAKAEEKKPVESLEFALKKKADIPARWYNAAIPYITLLIVFTILLFYSGATGGTADGGVGWDADVKDIIGNANSWAVLQWTGGLTITFQVMLYGIQYNKAWGGCLMWPREVIASAIDGSKEYFTGALALMLAFCFADTLKALQIHELLVQSLSETLSPAELPALTFILCAMFSMATGTSWGTMTVFFPICIPLAMAIATRAGVDPTDVIVTSSAAVLGGAVWGDHCSPVSDTTILSAAASSCSLFDHTKTQLPYAGLCGLLAILFGFLPAGAGCPAGVCILLGLIVVPLAHFGLSMIPKIGGPIGTYDPDRKEIIGMGFAGTKVSVKQAWAKVLAKRNGKAQAPADSDAEATRS